MKILKMKASFGVLNGTELALDPSLNVIASPNESGKSTWCAFIRAMLYGIDTSEREKKGQPKPDKIKYAPWNGSPMEGTMDIEAGGTRITLTRRSSAAGPMREFSAVYAGTDEPVPGLNGKNAGEALTGVPAGVFERSAFIRQSGLKVEGSPELNRRIAAIVSTGEESGSYTEADERLRVWLRRRQHNKTGLIPELERREDALYEKLRELTSGASESAELDEDIKRAEDSAVKLREAVTERRRLSRRDALERLSQRQASFSALESKLDGAREQSSRLESELEGSLFGFTEPDEARGRAEDDANSARELEAASASKVSAVPAVVLFVLAAISLATAFIWAPAFIIGISCGIALLAGGCICLARYFKLSRAVREARASLNALLREYSANSAEDIELRFAEHEKLWARYQSALAERDALSAERDRAEREQPMADSEILNDLDFISGDNEAARLGRELKSAEERLLRLRERRAGLEGERRVKGDPMAIESELLSVRDELGSLTEEYDALSLAVEVMREANAEIQTRFSPECGHRAAGYLERLTNGRYDALTLDRELNAIARAAGDIAGRDLGFLSEGAADQVYLSLRLAICDLALPGEDPCPVILDDALVNFDGGRTENALRLLGEIAQTRQVILFTCHDL